MMKKHSFPVILGTIILVLGLFSVGVICLSHNNTEKQVENYNGTEYETELFKDRYYYGGAAKALCEKFNLDYDTLTHDEYVSNKEYVDYYAYYYSASSLKLDSGDNVLLEKYSAKEAMDIYSLETYCNEVYAFGGAKDVIEEVCKKYSIDVKSAHIKDLTLDQIMEIETACYERSDHPKD